MRADVAADGMGRGIWLGVHGFPARHALAARPARRPGVLRSGRWPLVRYLELAAVPGAVPSGRLHTRQVLGEWALPGLREDAELVVSELLTNAVRASAAAGRGMPVRLRLLSDGERVEVRVWDGDPVPPRRMTAACTDEGGRGLMLVEAVSAAWDWRPVRGGKEVRALLDSRPAKAGQPGIHGHGGAAPGWRRRAASFIRSGRCS